MDNSEFDHGGGGGGGGSPAAATTAAMAAVDDRDRWRWLLMVVVALDIGHATTSRRSKRVAEQEDKRSVQGEATQQSALLSSAMPLWQLAALSSIAPPCCYAKSLFAVPPQR